VPPGVSGAFATARRLGVSMPPRDDVVLRPTRAVAAFIIPFLVVAFVVLFPWPSDVARLFAWPIKPTLSPMILGSVYIGGAYFFFRVVRASQWHTVAGGFLPVATFAGLMGITTILHWNKFVHDRLAFWLWVGLYFTTPFVVFAVFVVNRRRSLRSADGELLMPHLAAMLIGVGGACAVLMSAFMYLFPQHAVDNWPWKLTPLTARMLSAIFALGLAGLGAFWDRRWSSARVLLQVAGVMLALIFIAGIRAHSQFNSSRPLTWMFAAGFGATVIAGAAFYVQMESRARSAPA
jgi:uncharacterized membrane protein YciS (DUF1049 family)